MEYSWLLPVLTLLFSAVVSFLYSTVSPRQSLPPSPAGLPFVNNHSLLGKTIGSIGSTFHRLRSVYGPIFTLPFIFIAHHSATHRALVAAGTNFADRPPFLVPRYIGIFAAGHGRAWSLLQCNLTSEILHPTSYKSFADAWARALGLLLGKLVVKFAATG